MLELTGQGTFLFERELFAHCLLIAELIKLRKFLITDGVHTENTEGNGGPQVDFVGERKLFTHCQLKEEFIKLKQVSEIIRKLKKIILV